MNRPEPRVSKAELDQLTSYFWPGNVRELQNTVERAIIPWREGPLNFDLPASPALQDTEQQPRRPRTPRPYPRRTKRQERETIISALKQTSGKLSGPRGAAELLGMKSSLTSRISQGTQLT